uniref:alcohol dehydrogenase (NADP(+)) n=1 Tax=Pseudodiaptomus poplesia TaxID=213370 RepID=A0A1S6GL66_9MAXI|nr:alcohol dehydrogenase [Pseudodiaptomus poplesia]
MASVPSVTFSNNLTMPIVGLGTWKSKPGEVQTAVETAIKAGYRHIDCAAVYGNEQEVGEGIRNGGVDRAELFITSKLWNTKHHPEDVEGACRQTLKDLGLDYLDLYLIHWPTAFERGDDKFPKNEDGTVRFAMIPPMETWLAMEKLVEKGLVRSVGLSNFNSEQIAEILAKGKIKPATNQVECHPHFGQHNLIQFCKERNIVITAYSPLGSPDRPWAKPDDPQLLDDPKIKEMAAKYGKSPAQVVLRWQTQRGVVVIPKSVNKDRIAQNLDLFNFTLSEDDVKVINAFDHNTRLIVPVLDGKPRDAAHPHYPFNIPF